MKMEDEKMAAGRDCYFISDLHLQLSKPAVTTACIKFCRKMAELRAHLYIMGDLFDFWVGDDLMGAMEREVLAAILEIKQQGGVTYFQEGNRDFLVGKKFYRDSGCLPLVEHELTNLDGAAMFLAHGDSLCVRDRGFQLTRTLIRNRLSKQLLLRLSAEERSRRAARVPELRDRHHSKYPVEMLHIPEPYLHKLLIKHDLDILIHGHLHTPKDQRVELEGKVRQLVCLGAWGDTRVDSDRFWFGKLVPGVRDTERTKIVLYSLPLAAADQLDTARPLLTNS